MKKLVYFICMISAFALILVSAQVGVAETAGKDVPMLLSYAIALDNLPQSPDYPEMLATGRLEAMDEASIASFMAWQSAWQDWQNAPVSHRDDLDVFFSACLPHLLRREAVDNPTVSPLILYLTNNTSETLKAMFCLAAYDSDGKMTDLRVQKIDLAGDVMTQFTLNFTQDSPATVKAFLLDEANMIPIGSAWIAP